MVSRSFSIAECPVSGEPIFRVGALRVLTVAGLALFAKCVAARIHRINFVKLVAFDGHSLVRVKAMVSARMGTAIDNKELSYLSCAESGFFGVFCEMEC